MWTPRKIVDRNFKHPFRFRIKDPSTRETIKVIDLEKVVEPDDIEGTPIDAALQQPIEDYLGEVSESLSELQVFAAQSEAAFTKEINSLSGRVDLLSGSLAGLAPLDSPVLTNPTANTVPISSNSTALATTAAVYAYLNSLVAGWNS